HVHFDVELHKDLFKVDAPINVNLGLDGLGLKVDGGVTLNAPFDANVSFGVSKKDGFYLDAGDNVQVSFKAQRDGKTRLPGKLDFFENAVTPAGAAPQLTGSAQLRLNALHHNAKLARGDLTTGSAFMVAMSAAANVNFHLNASFTGNQNLPH